MEKKHDKELIVVDEDNSSAVDKIQQVIGSDWAELNETTRKSLTQALQHSLKPHREWVKGQSRETLLADAEVGELTSVSELGLRMWEQQDHGDETSEEVRPNEGPPRAKDLRRFRESGVWIHTQVECTLAPWRVSRAGDVGKCEVCKNEKKREARR